MIEIAILRAAPCCAHAKTCRAAGLGLTRRFQHRVERQDFLRFDTGVVTRGLWAITAIFRAAARLDRHQRRQFDVRRIEVLAMHLLRTEQQIAERHIEQRDDVFDLPVTRLGRRRWFGAGNRTEGNGLR